MPHKMNARTCERIGGFHVILRGPSRPWPPRWRVEQWNEGDVSCSVVRRVRPAGRLLRAGWPARDVADRPAASWRSTAQRRSTAENRPPTAFPCHDDLILMEAVKAGRRA
jgi:hypothetical protein